MAAVQASAHFAQNVIETVRTALVVLDRDLRVESANRAFYETFRVTPPETVGAFLYDLGNRQWDIPELRVLLETILPQRNTVEDYAVVHDFDHLGRRTMLVNARTVSDPKGDAPRILLAIEDVSERKETEEKLRASEQRFARFMQHLPGLAWIKDAEGRYVYVNDAAEAAFRVPRADLYGRNDREIFPPATAAQFTRNDRLALDSQSSIQAIEALEQADGVVHHSVVNKFVIPAHDGSPAMVGGVAIDVTELMEAEEALSQVDRRKDEFLAMLAHELRNPLAPILASIEILRLALEPRPGAASAPGRHPSEEGRRPEPDLRDRTTHALKVMQRQVEHMSRLVDDLLDAGRFSQGRIELRKERFELSAILSETADAVRPLVERRAQVLTVTLPTSPVYVDADPTRLAQIVGNLLSNACKFTPREGGVWLAAEVLPDSLTVEIRVRDTGIGIAPDQRARIFDLFAQVDTSLERRVSGLGIGLTLARSLTEMHGGTLEVSSPGLGLGCEFVVRLPIARRQTDTETVAASPATYVDGVGPQRILVVDDNHDSAEALAILLNLQGHETFTAHDGLAAVEAATAHRPDLVLMDIGLPGLNGYEAAGRIRERLTGPDRPLLVALTGWGNTEDRQRSAAAGFDAHLVKPVDDDVLNRLIARLAVENPTSRG